MVWNVLDDQKQVQYKKSINYEWRRVGEGVDKEDMVECQVTTHMVIDRNERKCKT